MSDRHRNNLRAAVHRWKERGRVSVVLATAGASLGTGCDVTNPGRIQDEFITLPESQEAFVNGANRRLVEAVNDLGYTGALVAREIFPGGQTGAHGHDVLVQGGYLEPGSFDGHFNEAQQASYIAQEALRRFADEGMDVPQDLMFRAYNWAGYANRVLGEHWCEAVFEGGPLEPGIRYFEEAEEHFTNAIDAAPDAASRRIATAGRAQVRVWLGDWAGAASDAAEIPDDFVFSLNMDNSDPDTRNMIYWANANQPYRAYTIWNTYYEDYYLETGDPRTRWTEDPEIPYSNASLAGYGQTLWKNQLKYTDPSDDVRLASGREMRFIEAEALLVAGQWQEAMDIINGLRESVISDVTGEPLEPWPANSLEEAWTRLKRERGIELWLEGRRLGDQRRWIESGTPGDLELADFEAISPIFSEHPRSLCFDIPDGERDANPNIPGVNSS